MNQDENKGLNINKSNEQVDRNVNDQINGNPSVDSNGVDVDYDLDMKAWRDEARPSDNPNEEDIPSYEKMARNIAMMAKMPKKKKRRKERFFLKLGILFLGVIGLFAFLTSSYFDVDKISVVNNERFDSKEIVKMSKVKKGENIFTIRKKLISNRLEANPYISKVKINKDFPRTIVIEVIERKPFVTIRIKEKQFILLNRDGYVLEERKRRPRIPLIKGLKIKSKDIGEKIKVEDKDLLKKSMEMIDIMKEQGLFFKKIDLTDESEYKVYIYDMLVIKGSEEGVIKHLKNGNITTIVYDLYRKKIKRGTIQIKGDEFCSFTPIF